VSTGVDRAVTLHLSQLCSHSWRSVGLPNLQYSLILRSGMWWAIDGDRYRRHVLMTARFTAVAVEDGRICCWIRTARLDERLGCRSPVVSPYHFPSGLSHVTGAVALTDRQRVRAGSAG